MDDVQIALVRANFAQVAPISAQAAALFYGRLFEIAPPLRDLFRGDMAEQGTKLMAMLATAVANLDRLDAIVPAVRALGARHATYGVQAADYGPVPTTARSRTLCCGRSPRRLARLSPTRRGWHGSPPTRFSLARCRTPLEVGRRLQRRLKLRRRFP